MKQQGLLNYYKACFQEDSADFNLRNLQRLDKADILYISGRDEIASGELPRLPIMPDKAAMLAKRAEMYERERVILHCSLFVVGKGLADNDERNIFSPIIFNEALISNDEYGYYFAPVETIPSVNEDLIASLLPQLETLPIFDSNRLYDAAYWATILRDSPFDIQVMEAMRFPDLVPKSVCSAALRRNTPSLLNISVLAFVERSASSRGLLHELTQMQTREVFSSPIDTLFHRNDERVKHRDDKRQNTIVPEIEKLPGLLSDAQEKVLNIAVNKCLGVVSGPPGTGKSYTIAASAAEHVIRGDSVLIVANSETALDVIAQKLSDDFKLDKLFVRAGQKTFLRDFKQYLGDLLSGYYDFKEAEELPRLQRHLNALVSQISEDEKSILKQCERAIKLGHTAYNIKEKQAGFWETLLYSLRSKSIKDLEKLWHILSHFNTKLEQKEDAAAAFLNAHKAKRVSSLLANNRKSLQSFNRAVRARTSAKQAEYFAASNFEALLQGFPIWLVSLKTLHKVLPLTTELFDLLIIDEATQCNIASCLPAMERAKRALVVGDQKQLKHFSFLSKSKEQSIASALSFDTSSNESVEGLVSFRDNSILDLALMSVQSQEQVAFLDEHFRSQPELIHFSNESFYSGKLKVMQHRPCSTTGHIRFKRVEGERVSAGHNAIEANALVAQLQIIIENERQTKNASSIGVLSPYSKQAAYLSDIIEKTISLEDIQKHRLSVATPYGFQGEERDIMLLSFCIDSRSMRAAAYLNKADVFNVAVTRARHRQFVFVSLDETTLPNKNLLKQYIAASHRFAIQHQISEQPDEFQAEIAELLLSHDIETWRGFEMLGVYVDLLAKMGDRYLAIDLIGYPGPWADYFELNTYKVMKRAGIEVFPLSYALWLQDKEACLNALLSLR